LLFYQIRLAIGICGTASYCDPFAAAQQPSQNALDMFLSNRCVRAAWQAKSNSSSYVKELFKSKFWKTALKTSLQQSLKATL
jgi:hypothetical protein